MFQKINYMLFVSQIYDEDYNEDKCFNLFILIFFDWGDGIIILWCYLNVLNLMIFDDDGFILNNIGLIGMVGSCD